MYMRIPSYNIGHLSVRKYPGGSMWMIFLLAFFLLFTTGSLLVSFVEPKEEIQDDPTKRPDGGFGTAPPMEYEKPILSVTPWMSGSVEKSGESVQPKPTESEIFIYEAYLNKQILNLSWPEVFEGVIHFRNERDDEMALNASRNGTFLALEMHQVQQFSFWSDLQYKIGLWAYASECPESVACEENGRLILYFALAAHNQSDFIYIINHRGEPKHYECEKDDPSQLKESRCTKNFGYSFLWNLVWRSWDVMYEIKGRKLDLAIVMTPFHFTSVDKFGILDRKMRNDTENATFAFH